MRNKRESTERVATAIVSGLNAIVLRTECATDCDAICYAVRSQSLKLRSIVLGRDALQRLLTGADGVVKIEYLRRELLSTAKRSEEYRYPPPSRRQPAA